MNIDTRNTTAGTMLGMMLGKRLAEDRPTDWKEVYRSLNILRSDLERLMPLDALSRDLLDEWLAEALAQKARRDAMVREFIAPEFRPGVVDDANELYTLALKAVKAL